MRARCLITAVAIAVGAGVVTPVAATAAKTKPDLDLTKVTPPPATAKAGGRFIVKVKVSNRGERAGKGVVKMTLEGGPKPYALPRRIARFETGRVSGETYKRYTVRLTVPLDQGSGSYRLRTCLKFKGAEQCRSSRRVAVTAA